MTRVLAAAMCLLLVCACGASTTPVTPSGSQRPTSPPSQATPSLNPTSPTSPTSSAGPTSGVQPSPTPASTDATTDGLLAQMTTDQKIGQLFMVSFYGDTANETNTAQVKYNVAGIGANNVAQAYYRAAINICLFSSSAASLTALARALFGEIDTAGRLPVSIPSATNPNSVLYPLGFGIHSIR